MKDKIYDVIIIGGGPGGMMSSVIASNRGLSVLLIEKNAELGKKLLLTGNGRCNLTNAEFDTRKFLENYGDESKFLFSPFSQFGVKDTINFFNDLGVKTKVEERLRVFPISDKAETIRSTLLNQMKKNGVTIMTETKVIGFVADKKEITHVKILNDGKEIKMGAKSFILAVGGTSHPETGSTGDGFAWLKEINHKVNKPEPSLVPLAIKDGWVKNLQGVTLPDVKISVFAKDERKFSKTGRILFTHFGISGPTIINMSKEVGKLLKESPVEISLDIFPLLNLGELDKKLIDLFDRNKNKQFKNCISEFVPPSMSSAVAYLSGIDETKEINSITKEERDNLVRILKDMCMNVSHLLPAEESIVASGGVSPTEVNFKNMSSVLYPNLFFVGDILDITRPSGGFSLQLCWTTAFVAGNAV